jgi:hypothetical protein
MVCEHLKDVEAAMLAQNLRATFRGQAWSNNCREWVYFDAWLDNAAIRSSFTLAPCVQDHSHRGTHDGQESGLVCETCHDALMGYLQPVAGKPSFPGVKA